jgi:hypothetical protein
MGKLFADDLSELGLGMSESIRIHLAHNHYPPVPQVMVQVCIKAIDSYNANLNGDELIELPEGILWRGNRSAPAWAIIESHHLDSWCDSDSESD